MCGHADHPSAYAIVGLEYFLMDQNLSMLGAPHSTPPSAHQFITMSRFACLWRFPWGSSPACSLGLSVEHMLQM